MTFVVQMRWNGRPRRTRKRRRTLRNKTTRASNLRTRPKNESKTPVTSPRTTASANRRTAAVKTRKMCRRRNRRWGRKRKSQRRKLKRQRPRRKYKVRADLRTGRKSLLHHSTTRLHLYIKLRDTLWLYRVVLFIYTVIECDHVCTCMNVHQYVFMY